MTQRWLVVIETEDGTESCEVIADECHEAVMRAAETFEAKDIKRVSVSNVT